MSGELNWPEPLPEWSCGLASGAHQQLNAQLCTKDGRAIGNARVVYTISQFSIIITDAGNCVVMNKEELENMFYPPKFLVKPDDKLDIKKMRHALMYGARSWMSR